MKEFLITNSLKGTPFTISATSMLSLGSMGTGALRSSVFEINNSSSNVNFISHVWSCCSDLFFAEKACGPKGRQVDSFESNLRDWSRNEQGKKGPDQGHALIYEPKQVSVIDADHSNEVRFKSVPFFNTENQDLWE